VDKTNSAPRISRSAAVFAVLFAALALTPLSGDLYLLTQLTQLLVYGIFAMSLSLIWGHVGILCFGQAIFFGLGGYIMALVTKGMVPGMTGWLASSCSGLILAIFVTVFFALALGYFLFYGRLSGPYLGIVTLAISVLMERIAVNWYYIGGYNGLTSVPALNFFGFELLDPNELYYFILASAAAMYLFCRGVVISPFGRVLAAIKNNEERAEYFGYNTAQYKIKVFAISAGVAAFSGALFATVAEFVSPTIVGFGLSTEALIWVALGGREVLLASFLGALTVRALEAFLSDILTYYWILILGLFLILCVTLFPQGLFGRLLADRPKS